MDQEEQSRFLTKFYQAKRVEKTFFTGVRRKGKKRTVSEEVPEEETALWSRRSKVSLFLFLVLIPATIALGVIWYQQSSFLKADSVWERFGSRSYYFVSFLIMLYAMFPFFMIFEKRKAKAREIVILASLSALACVGRAAFFMVPFFKPLTAIVIISAISLGAESGFLIGVMSMFVSNFFFGQGPWTPWQMFAMGLIGFLFGMIYHRGKRPYRTFWIGIMGGIFTIVIYGTIMNVSTVFLGMYEVNWQSIVSALVLGFPVDLIHGVSTCIFLWIAHRPLYEKLHRIKMKYGLCTDESI